ncbi:proteasome stabiliser [Nitzschia inconspicua]|uniref:Proteasome stabiliser n=1 Tax=Nitzschia inconspicua TaxID=303405 RepID=A0A9K3LEF4_9STRA|nr:proteasome stabiliser [Nitzschia inconspicua]
MEEQHKTAVADLASLGRVSHRLALVDTSQKLQTVLDKLLPRLLQRIGDNHQQQLQLQSKDPRLQDTLSKIHFKLVEMLSHIMKRVRDDQSCKLNANGILSLLLETNNAQEQEHQPTPQESVLTLTAKECDAFSLNLSLAFLTLAIPRCSSTELETLLPGLLVLLAFYEEKVEQEIITNSNSGSQLSSASTSTTVKQWCQISHLLLRTMEKIVQDEEIEMKKRNGTSRSGSSNANKRIKTDQEESTGNENESTHIPFGSYRGLEQARDLLIHNPLVAGATYDLLLDVFLYETQVGNVPPAGLSSMGWERLKTGHSSKERDWAAEMAPQSRLAACKARLIEWVAPHRQRGLFLGCRGDHEGTGDDNDMPLLLGKSRTLILLVVASGDPMQSVSETAKQYLKQYYDSRRSNTNNVFGNADQFCKELLRLCVGEINAEMLLATADRTGQTETRNNTSPIGFGHYSMPFRRRQISDSFYSESVEAVTKALEDMTDSGILDIGKLSLLSSDSMLSKLPNAMGLNNLRGRPFVLAADQLICLMVRLDKMKEGDPATTVFLQSRALTLATQVLLPVAATKVSSSSNAMSEPSVAVRDSVYGVISILSRSSFAEENFLCLMAAGGLDATTLSTDLLRLLFPCVANEVDKLRPRAMAALDALLFACRRQFQFENGLREVMCGSRDNPWMSDATHQRSTALTPILPDLFDGVIATLLWTASKNSQSRQARVAAARWASDLLMNLDLVKATHLLCYLSGDPDVTVSAVAREGLGLTIGGKADIAGFEELCGVLFPAVDQPSRPNFYDFSTKGKTVAVKCILKSFLDDFHGDEAGLTLATEALTATLLTEGLKDMDLIDSCAEVLSVFLGLSTTARSLVASSSFGLGCKQLSELVLSSGSAKARRFLAESFSNLMTDLPKFEGSLWVQIISESVCTSSDILNDRTLKSTGEVHGAALLGGICIKLLHLDLKIDWGGAISKVSRLMVCLGEGLLSPDESVGNFCCDGISLLCSLGHGQTLLKSLVPAMTKVLSSVQFSLLQFGNGEQTNAPRTLKILKPAGLAMALANTMAMECVAGPLSECVSATIKLLGSDSFRKDEEVALYAGEALAKYACAHESTMVPSQDLSIGWPTELSETFARSLTPPAHVIYSLLRIAKTTNNNHQRRACAPALLAVVSTGANTGATIQLRRLLQWMLEEIQDCFLFLLTDSKSSQLSRESCCLGLIALNKLVRSTEEETKLQERLLRGFGQTTNYGGSAMQETAAQAEERRRAEGSIGDVSEQSRTSAEVEIGGAAGMSEASLGAYVEIAAAAVACGHPRLVYSMLMLSVSHAVWSTKERRDMYGPAALHSSEFNKDEVKVALRPYLARLLPRILRASHDPNKQTREQMEILWAGLTGGGEEGRLAISRFLRPTIDALVEETASKLWRTRVGACGALSQVIVGRSWLELGGGEAVLDENYDLVISKTSSETTVAGIRLLRLWRCSLRALDDVRITVRESGEALGRSVRSLTIRLCNPNQDINEARENCNMSFEKDATAAAATALRFLLKSGLKQQCAEATGICISTLIGIIDIAAKPAILEALLADVLYALLVALSNLEPAALSYLSARQEAGSSEYEDLAKLRLSAAQNTPLAMAVRKCIDMVPLLTTTLHREAIVGSIELAIRKSTGIATRSACADCVITLCHTTPEIFRSNTSANSLLRCFFEGIFKERGGKVAQNKMNAAFGSLAALCSGAEVRKIAVVCTERYKNSHGNNDDPDSRHAAALTLRSIAVKAASQLSQQSELWRKTVLPVSFLGMNDPNNPDASLWKEVWEDGGAAIDLVFGESDENTMEEKILPYLVRESVDALKDVSWNRRMTGAFALADLADRGVLAPPPRRLDGKSLFQTQRRAKARAEVSTEALSSLVQLVARSRVWSGKAEVVKATTQVAIPWVRCIDTSEVIQLLGECGVIPLVNEGSSATYDLFHGDQWFKRNNDSSEESLHGTSDNEDESKSEGSQKGAVSIVGLCRLLLVQAFPSDAALQSVTSDEILPFRSQVLQSLEILLLSLPKPNGETDELRKTIMSLCSPTLYKVIEEKFTKEQPLIVARAMSCFAATFQRNMAFYNTTEGEPYLDALKLSSLLLHHVDYSKQSAWTVREAAAKCSSKMVQSANAQTLRQGQFISDIVQIASVAMKDKKFWKVRHSSLLILQSVVMRGGEGTGEISQGGEKELILEAILPFKEIIQGLVRKALIDNEAHVTALATKILSLLTAWP